MQKFSTQSGRLLDEIRLRDFEVSCIIGINPDEFERPQRLLVKLVLHLDTSIAAVSGCLMETIDYAVLARDVRFILQHGRFKLIESAAEALAMFVLSPCPHDRVQGVCEAVEVELTKVEALGGEAIPSIRIWRESQERVLDLNISTWNMMFTCPETSLFRGLIPAGTCLHPWLPGWTVASVMTGAPGLSVNKRSLEASEIVDAIDFAESGISNPTSAALSFFAVAHRDPSGRHHMGSARPLGLIQSTLN